MKISLNPYDSKSIDNAIKQVKEYQKWLKLKTEELINEFANRGWEIASARYDSAYTTNNDDVIVKIEDYDNGKGKLLVALGWSVLFIEFGTGIQYPDNHPEKPDDVLGRGEYGYGMAKGRTWVYKGDSGKNPPSDTKTFDTPNGQETMTKGIPASMAMYLTREELLQQSTEIIRKVFTE